VSDILIRGMSLPKEGYRQVFITAEGEVICFPTTPANGERRYMAVELPPHGDLIDRCDIKNKEITIDYDEWDDTFEDGLLFVTNLIDDAPTIIPADEEARNNGTYYD